ALIGLGAVDATFELLPVVDGGVVSGHVLLRMGGAPGAGGSRRGQGSRVKRSQPATCGVVDDPDGAERPRVAQSQGGNRRMQIIDTKFVQLVLVADYAEFVKMGRDMGAVRSRLMQIANHVDRLYRQLRVRVLLVGVEVWSQNDRSRISVDPSVTLAEFSEWRVRDLATRVAHSNAQLVTGVDFSGDTVGLAYVGTMCGSKSAGVNQDHSDSAVPIASTMAHEMGHNFGMSHDHEACECPAAASQGGCLLAPSL
ncbi:snake venom metalloproteinase neuwiedase-like, partial [Lampetra fluviatilis]